MLNITGFLEKFKKIDGNKNLQKENIIKSIEKVIGIIIENKNFDIKDGVLYIKASPALRQEVFMKKAQLLGLISSDGIIDIR